MRTKAYKAVTALIATGAAALGTAMLDGALTGSEAIVAAGTALVAGAAVWRIPNPPKGDHRRVGDYT